MKFDPPTDELSIARNMHRDHVKATETRPHAELNEFFLSPTVMSMLIVERI